LPAQASGISIIIGMRQRIAAAHQEFERVVEAGRVGLAFGIGNRPQLLDVGAEQRRRS
jgi:hypothetical protein